MNNCENKLKLSNFLLEKYSDIINEREQRTIGEVKELVSGEDLSIQSFVDQFKEDYYDFEKNYEETIKKLFKYVQNNIEYIETDFRLNFWLSSKEVLELKVADDEDLAVFLCNVMKALGDNKAGVVIAELENLKTHAFVMTEINDNTLLLDPCQEHNFEDFFDKKSKVIMNYSFNKSKIRKFLYRFNSEKYEQFVEE
jgi:hypothetical protein